MHAAATSGNDDVAKLLLAAKSDVNAKDQRGRTPLHVAADQGRENVVRLLLANGASVNAKDKEGNTPCCAAESNGRPIAAKLLREHGGHDFRGEILAAARSGDLEVVKTLLTDDPDLISVNSHRDGTGRSLVQEAVANGRKDVAEFLLVHGADSSTKLRDGKTLLHLAASKDVVDLLLNNGADVN